jgi:phage host-nuclease inhibitor protein Gam
LILNLETTAESADSSNRSSPDSQEISNLQEEIKSLENQLKDSQSSIDLLKNNLQLITYENEQLKQQYNEIQEKYDLLIKDTQNQTITPVQSSNIDEIQQLQTNLSLPTTQHSQLDEANHAWQQFHQNQLEHFRNKLQDYIPLDESISFHQVAQLIVDQIIKERKEFEKANHDLRTESKNNLDSIRESYVNTIKELNQELIDIKEQCQEFERINKQLLIENENLNDRSIVVGHHSQIDLNLVEQPIEQNHIAMETIPFDSTHMINQQTQTESLWSIVSYENSSRQNNLFIFSCSLMMKIL